MKPHEETWESGDGPGGMRIYLVRDGGATLIADDVSDHREPLMTAAPEMARTLGDVLRGFNQGYRLTPADAERIRLVLTKAGVPCP